MSKVFENKSNGQRSSEQSSDVYGMPTGTTKPTPESEKGFQLGEIYWTMTKKPYKCVQIIKDAPHGYVFEPDEGYNTFIYYLDKYGCDRNGKRKMKGGLRRNAPPTIKIGYANLMKAFEAICDRLDRLETHIGVKSTSTAQVKSFLSPDERKNYQSLSHQSQA